MERLEWLGDALLQFLSSRLLYERYPHLPEGALSLARESLVSGGALAAAARAQGLAQKLRGEALSDTALAGKVEEHFAHLYLQDGLQAADSEMRELFKDALAKLEHKINAGENLKSPKTALQELTQADGGKPPEYVLLEKRGKPHNFLFIVECRAADGITARGEGKTVRAAEQNAAQKCLQQMPNNDSV